MKLCSELIVIDRLKALKKKFPLCKKIAACCAQCSDADASCVRFSVWLKKLIEGGDF